MCDSAVILIHWLSRTRHPKSYPGLQRSSQMYGPYTPGDIYGGLHQKFWTPLFRPMGQLMRQNPKELPKAHSNAHAKTTIVWKTATVKRK